jgi:hypothetical protein
MDHASDAVAPPDADVVQVGDIIWQQAQRRGLVPEAARHDATETNADLAVFGMPIGGSSASTALGGLDRDFAGGTSDRVFSTCSPTTTGSPKPPRTPGCLSLHHTIPERCGDRYSQSPSLTWCFS